MEGKGKYANQQKEKGWAPTGDCHSKSMDQGKIQVPAQVRNKIKYHSHPQKEKSQCTEQKTHVKEKQEIGLTTSSNRCRVRSKDT